MGLLMTVINNIISILLTLAIVFVAPLIIAYAGFLMVINQGDSGKITEARNMLTNLVVGIVLALAGWMIVNTLMVIFYDKSVNGGKDWWAIVSGTDVCITQAGALPNQGLNQATTTPVSTGTPQAGRSPGPCADGNTACSVSAIKSAAQALSPSLTLTDAQATSMSCIAMTESSGHPDTPNSNTGACGTFQITTQPGNWSIAAFHQGSCSASTSCNDPQCNLQTALLLYQQRGYQPWTGKKPDGTYWNANAVACVKQYEPAVGATL
jgi:hypothetical protein